MFRWLYRLLFARRAVWALEKEIVGSERGKIRLTVYDPEPEDVEKGFAIVDELLLDGWRIVSAPPRPE